MACAERRVGQQRDGGPPTPICPAPRCSCRSIREPSSDFGVVEVDHRPAGRARCALERRSRKRVDRRRVGDSIPAAPRVRGVEAEADRVGSATPRAAMASAMSASSRRSSRARSRCRPSSRGRSARARRARRRRPRRGPARQAVGEPPVPAATPAAAMRADVDVDEPRREPGRARRSLGEDLDRALVEVRDRAGQVHEVRRRGSRPAGCRARSAARGRRGLVRGRRTPPPGGRVVAEDLERRGADLVRPVDGLDHSARHGQVGAEAASVGKHPRHRTTCGRRRLDGPVVRGRQGLPTTRRGALRGGRAVTAALRVLAADDRLDQPESPSSRR